MKSLEELKDFAIGERIEMLLHEQMKQSPKKSEEEIEIIEKAEKYLKSLDEDTHQLLNNYIDQLFSTVVRNDVYLYKQGFCDGVKVVHRLQRLDKIE